MWQRCTAAGLLVGLCSIAVPEIMGLGYDTVNAILIGQFGLSALVVITIVKLFATTACVGLGIPGGLIGPTLVIGTAAGGALGIIGAALLPQEASPIALYAMVGMAAMMSATLQAPLAALMALVELTAGTYILFPGMLAVVVANLVAREGLHQEALFLMLLRTHGLDYHYAPISLRLRQAGVASVMDRHFVELPVITDRETALQALAQNPRWVLVKQDFQPHSVVQAADVARALSDGEQAFLNLMEIPAVREDIQAVSFHATLQEALEILDASQAKMLYVTRRIGPTSIRTYGVLSRPDIESYYG